MKIGDTVIHTKDKYTGKIIKLDNIFIHLDNGKSMLRNYAEVITEDEWEKILKVAYKCDIIQ